MPAVIINILNRNEQESVNPQKRLSKNIRIMFTGDIIPNSDLLLAIQQFKVKQ